MELSLSMAGILNLTLGIHEWRLCGANMLARTKIESWELAATNLPNRFEGSASCCVVLVGLPFTGKGNQMPIGRARTFPLKLLPIFCQT
jgi:hypothetical protein